MKTHKDLEVWKLSIELVSDVYKMTKLFPKEESYGITNQIRRAAVSIPANIAEGAGRHGLGELKQFIGIAKGSLSELETLLLISKNLGYINDNDFETINQKLTSIFKMLASLIKSLSLKPCNL